MFTITKVLANTVWFYKGELHVQHSKIKGQYSSSPPILHGDGTRGKQIRIWENPNRFKEETLYHWHKLSREAVESLPLETFKTWLYGALSNLVWPRLEQGVGPDDLQPKWFYETLSLLASVKLLPHQPYTFIQIDENKGNNMYYFYINICTT